MFKSINDLASTILLLFIHHIFVKKKFLQINWITQDFSNAQKSLSIIDYHETQSAYIYFVIWFNTSNCQKSICQRVKKKKFEHHQCDIQFVNYVKNITFHFFMKNFDFKVIKWLNQLIVWL